MRKVKLVVLLCLLAYVALACTSGALIGIRNHPDGAQLSGDYIGNLLSAMNTWITTIGVAVTVLLGGAIIGELAKTLRTDKRMDEFDRRVSDQITNFQSQYSIKPPDAILKEARQGYEPMIKYIEETLKQRSNDLSSRLDRADAELVAARAEIRKELRDFEKMYLPTLSQEEFLVNRVLKAFLCVTRLTEDERKAITDALMASSTSFKAEIVATTGQ